MARPTCRSFASRVAGLLLPVVSFGSAQDPPEEPIAPEDQAVLDEFAAALERFQGMTVDEFLADRASGGDRLTDEEWKASLEAGSGGARPAWTSSFVRG